jgi:hypothetical protein
LAWQDGACLPKDHTHHCEDSYEATPLAEEAEMMTVDTSCVIHCFLYSALPEVLHDSKTRRLLYVILFLFPAVTPVFLSGHVIIEQSPRGYEASIDPRTLEKVPPSLLWKPIHVIARESIANRYIGKKRKR